LIYKKMNYIKGLTERRGKCSVHCVKGSILKGPSGGKDGLAGAYKEGRKNARI